MELAVVDINGKASSKKVKLESSVFGIEPNDHAIYLDVKQHLAGKRQGTHKSKERAEIAGSTRKIKRQKGTGTARAGSIKNPIFRGGGRAFGPRPKSYDFKVNKKVKKLARKSALSYKAKDSAITVLKDFKLDAPKTKSFVEMLNALKLDGKKTLLVLADKNENILLSARNLQRSKVVQASDLNTYDIMNANNVILAEGSLEKINELLK